MSFENSYLVLRHLLFHVQVLTFLSNLLVVTNSSVNIVIYALKVFCPPHITFPLCVHLIFALSPHWIFLLSPYFIFPLSPHLIFPLSIILYFLLYSCNISSKLVFKEPPYFTFFTEGPCLKVVRVKLRQSNQRQTLWKSSCTNH